MTNSEISTIFRNIAALLQIRGETAFRARSYERAADIIEDFPDELTAETGYNEAAVKKLRATPGIGKAIEDKTVEMLQTGRCQFYDTLTAEMGTEILELLKLRGLGVKTVARFYQELDVRNLEDLRVLIESGRLKHLKGIGRKSLQMITESLAFHTAQRNKRPFWSILPTAERILERLKPLQDDGLIKRCELTGDLRRYEEMCSTAAIVVECENESAFAFDGELLPKLSGLFPETEVLFKNSNGLQYRYDTDSGTLIRDGSPRESEATLREKLPLIQLSVDRDFPVSLYLCTPETYAATFFLTTGTTAHLDALPENDLLEPRRFWNKTRNRTETEIYEALGLAHIPPELRQDRDSIDAAKARTLPKLIEFADLRGDLHAHTDWSDGRHTLQEMVTAAKEAGLDYFAITDHSVSSTVANGLDQQRLLEQIARVRELDAATEGITLLAGSEVDIRQHGELDFPNEILAQLDIVVASVHSHFTLTEAEMTRRIVRAIENPFVNIIGHPTGRLLGRRPMYALNLEEIIAAAAANQTALEINGSPHRLDLDPKFVRMAKEADVLLSVNTDAHAIGQLAHRHSGVNVARRGWLTKADVINTYTLETLREKCNIGSPR